ncbi:MAG: GAF domain-containing protein, partial [Candidatus Eremiobacterota bacterium]
MIEPEIPENEAERLGSLHRMCVLDTPAEARFDRLTRLAQRHFGVAFAMVTLVDRDRQWFKSIQGAHVVETPRSISFCAHTILDEQAMVIPDATLDPRFRGNPVVTGDLHVRFYAGVPVCSQDGLRVGTFCLVGNQPRGFDAEDLANLEDFAACAETELQVVRLTEQELSLLEQMDDLRRRASTDPLTRTWNRQAILELLARHRRAPLGLVLLGLDHLALINDSYGQAAGDDVLHGLAERLRTAVRPPHA